MFIDTVGASGTGIPLTPSDGVFNDDHEGGYADIPLTTIRRSPTAPTPLTSTPRTRPATGVPISTGDAGRRQGQAHA